MVLARSIDASIARERTPIFVLFRIFSIISNQSPSGIYTLNYSIFVPVLKFMKSKNG
jgi:hypothetical protein